eukprot:g18.t1
MGKRCSSETAASLALLASVCATFALPYLLWAPVTAKAFVSWDDVENFVENPHLRGGLSWQNVRWSFMDGVWLGTYEPVSNIAKMLVVTASGGEVRVLPFYLAAVLVHGVNSCLVLRVAKANGADLKRFPILTMLFVFLGFAVHPLRVECIAWASGFPYTLSTCFSLCACISNAKNTRKGDAITALCLLLAVWSKGSSITVPIVVGLDKFVGGNTGRDAFPRHKAEASFTVALFSSIVCVGFLSAWWGNHNSVSALSQTQVFFRACIAFWWYPSMHVWSLVKANVLSIQYELIYNDLSIAENPAELLFVSVATLLVIGWASFLTLKSACQRASGDVDSFVSHNLVAFFIVKYTVCLLPVLGLVQHGYVTLASDRYSYLPFAIVVCPYAAGCLCRLVRSPTRYTYSGVQIRFQWAFPLIGVMLVLAVTRTYDQISHWNNTDTLTKHALSKINNESSAQGVFVLALRGNGLVEQGGRDQEAIDVFERLLKHSSATTSPLILSHAHHGIAVASYRIAKELKDESWYLRSLEHKPEYPDALFGLANLLQRRGNAHAAISLYKSAIRLEPTATDLRMNLGLALRKVGLLDEAMATGRGILEIDKHHRKAAMLVEVCRRELRTHNSVGHI